MKRRKTMDTQKYEFIVSKLKQARREAGLKQQVVADKLGKYESYLSKIENGDRRIDILELVELADIYKKSLEFFIPRRGGE